MNGSDQILLAIIIMTWAAWKFWTHVECKKKSSCLICMFKGDEA